MDENDQKLKELSYAVSHDLGGAIRGVDQLTSLLEKDISHKLNEKERYWMQLIRSSAERAQGMIDGLTLYTRLSTQKTPARVLDVTDLVRTTVNSCLQKHRESSQNTNEPELQISLVELEVLGVAEHWLMLIQELINNALDFMPCDSHYQISVALTVNDNEAILVVEDSGEGVEQEQFSHITKPFSSSSDQGDLQHFGMGLSYCARIAQLNGATLQFSRSLLGGLKVSYQFPLRGLE
jgi:signal transduction histidine kinase